MPSITDPSERRPQGFPSSICTGHLSSGATAVGLSSFTGSVMLGGDFSKRGTSECSYLYPVWPDPQPYPTTNELANRRCCPYHPGDCAWITAHSPGNKRV